MNPWTFHFKRDISLRNLGVVDRPHLGYIVSGVVFSNSASAHESSWQVTMQASDLSFLKVYRP